MRSAFQKTSNAQRIHEIGCANDVKKTTIAAICAYQLGSIDGGKRPEQVNVHCCIHRNVLQEQPIEQRAQQLSDYDGLLEVRIVLSAVSLGSVLVHVAP